MNKTAVSLIALMMAVPVQAVPPQGVATEATRAANAKVAASLPIADQTDFENANRGFLARIEEDQILNADGSVAWDSRQFEFLQGDAPDTVNPSLWRQGKLNSIHGLFEVVPGIYQIRGYDLAQMTLIAGKTGWIVIDPLTTPAPAKAGLALANKTLGDRPVVAVIFTHSHGDHFGGVAGVASPEDIRSGKIEVIEFFWYGCPHCYCRRRPRPETVEWRCRSGATDPVDQQEWRDADGRRDQLRLHGRRRDRGTGRAGLLPAAI